MPEQQRILLTGATGYVGGRLLPLLEREGHRVRCLTRRPENLAGHLNARFSGSVQTVTIPEATHFVHLDRPERGRDLFLDAVGSFLSGSDDRS